MILPSTDLSNLPIFQGIGAELEVVARNMRVASKHLSLAKYNLADNTDSGEYMSLLLEAAYEGHTSRPWLADTLLATDPSESLKTARLIRLLDLSVNQFYSKEFDSMLEGFGEELVSFTPHKDNHFSSYVNTSGNTFFPNDCHTVKTIKTARFSPRIRGHIRSVIDCLSHYGFIDLGSDQLEYDCIYLEEQLSPSDSKLSLDRSKMTDAWKYLDDCYQNDFDVDGDLFFSHWVKCIRTIQPTSPSEYQIMVEKYQVELFKQLEVQEAYEMRQMIDDFSQYLAAKEQDPDCSGFYDLKAESTSERLELLLNRLPKPKTKADQIYHKFISTYKHLLIDVFATIPDYEEEEMGIRVSQCVNIVIDSDDMFTSMYESINRQIMEVGSNYTELKNPSDTLLFIRQAAAANAVISALRKAQDC